MKNRKIIRWLAAIVIVVILAAAALFNGPVTRRYTLTSDKIQNPIAICVIADLHSQYFGEHQADLIERIKKEEPHIILMPGDMTNSPYNAEGMVSFMEQAVNIAPCYYVLGNHEYWSNEADAILEMVQSTGVTVLRHESISLEIEGNTVELFGIDDYDANYYDSEYADKKWEDYLREMWSENTENNYRILMSHRPERVQDYIQYDYDLITTGHSHGGLVRIPFVLNGLYAPNQGWFPKYAGGEYALSDATTMVVSRGLYNYRHMPRVFCPSEIVIITISQHID